MNKRVLIINNRAITEDPIVILRKLKSELINGKLDIIVNKGASIQVQCPQHADGHEKHGSCYINVDSNNAPYLWVHCFTCDLSCDFIKFVALCFDSTYNYAKSWLLENFGETYVTSNVAANLTDIDLNASKTISYLNESILNSFESYHPYMKKRGLSDEVIKQFEIKYDPATKCVVFPVRDKHGKLIALTKRSVEGKRFIIDKEFDKTNIYLLYDIIANDTKEVYVCESQINALVLRSWGYPSIALFGAGTTYNQMKELNKTGIKHYILCYDPDSAGEKGAKRFLDFVRKDVFVDIVALPNGKDIADLTKEEFAKLLE